MRGRCWFSPEDAVGIRGVDRGDWGVGAVDKIVLVLEAGSEEGAVGGGEGIAFTLEGACDATLMTLNCHTGVFVEEG
jgi:hypothetical protein